MAKRDLAKSWKSQFRVPCYATVDLNSADEVSWSSASESVAKSSGERARERESERDKEDLGLEAGWMAESNHAFQARRCKPQRDECGAGRGRAPV